VASEKFDIGDSEELEDKHINEDYLENINANYYSVIEISWNDTIFIKMKL